MRKHHLIRLALTLAVLALIVASVVGPASTDETTWGAGLFLR